MMEKPSYLHYKFHHQAMHGALPSRPSPNDPEFLKHSRESHKRYQPYNGPGLTRFALYRGHSPPERHTTKTAKYCMFSAHKLYFRMTTDVYDGNSVKSRVFILKSKKYLRCLTQNIQSYSSDSPSCHRMCCWSCVFAFDRVPNYVICNLIRIYLFFCFTP